MAKRRTQQPYEQGSLKQIYEWFFGKLIFYKPHMMSINEWMEYLFDAKNRDVIRYVAKKPFKMPGLYCIQPNVKYQGVGYRKVDVGDVVWVRLDAREPNRIDIEWIGKEDRLFELNSTEWGWTKLHLEEMERTPKK